MSPGSWPCPRYPIARSSKGPDIISRLQGDLNSYYTFLNELGERFHASHHLVRRQQGMELRSFAGDEDGAVPCLLTGEETGVPAPVCKVVYV